MPIKIELLAPAKNLEFGKIAVNHGADAVYIGAAKFSARQAASNSLQDIELLVNYAHIYAVKVYVAVNTLLFDDELEDALKIINQIYEIGADAIIIQDFGLLELDLPPIPIHLSTQTNNYDFERIKFLDNCGFQRIILARELSIEQIKQIRENTSCELEAFIHGALCVCFSGQCYLSAAINGRSGNRGNCSQPCRSSYNLLTASNKKLLSNQHLLSIKDFNASEYLQKLLDMGIYSFKIEGRLKDETYLKNVTAHYRLLFDNIIENHNIVKNNNSFQKSSSGKTKFFFIPDVERTFNRGYTTYFLDGKRHKVGSPTTQKSLGKKIGTVKQFMQNFILLNENHNITNGDGLCFFDDLGKLNGFLVNKVADKKIFPNRNILISKGVTIYRNNDFQFEKQLKHNSSERKIAVDFIFSESKNGFRLAAKDEDLLTAEAVIDCEKVVAENPHYAEKQIISQLSKLNSTPFTSNQILFHTQQKYFISVSILNELRRNVVENLIQNRLKYFTAEKIQFVKKDCECPTKSVDFKANIINQKAVEFYKRHKVVEFEFGFERQAVVTSRRVLLRSKYCIKYELEMCRKYFQDREILDNEDLFLENGKNKFKLEFDCQKCEMLLF